MDDAGGQVRHPGRRGVLPAELTRFVGRKRELADARGRLERSRLVTLTGVGGVGKTRLALRLASDLRRAFPDGVFVVELAEVREPALVGHTVGVAVGLREHDVRQRLSALIDHLTARRVLLVLDNCEHLVDDCAALAEGLLRACPELRVLATSRQPLGVGGESVVPVPPLSLPETEQGATAASLTQYDAVSLFLDRAEIAVPGFTLTDENSADVARLCRLLDGLPLAIELAATRLRTLSVGELAERLDDRYRLLTGGSRSAPARQQTLRASIDWTYELCSTAERLLWARLSVFAGSFELDAAEGTCAGDGLQRSDILDLVASLVDKSVVAIDQRPGARRRFFMLETIRQYGAEKLEAAGDCGAWRRRHRDWYETLAARLDREWAGPGQPEWIERLRREHPNLRAALEFCATSDDEGEAEAGLRIAWRLETYWMSRGLLGETRHWLDRLLARAAEPTADRARGRRFNAWLAILQGDHDVAAALLDGAGHDARASGNAVAIAFVTQTLGLLAMFRGDLRRAIGLLGAAADDFRLLGHASGAMHTVFEAGLAAGLAGDGAGAFAWHARCLELARSAGDTSWRSWSLWAYGVELWREGDSRGAAKLQEESLRLKWLLDDQVGMAVCLEALAWIAASGGQGERAATLLGAAEALWRRTGMSLMVIGHMWAYREQGETAARRSIGERGFQTAFAWGTGMPTGEAIAYALGEAPRVPHRREVPSAVAQPGALTRRELEISELVAQGLSNRDIARELVISVRTAESHVDHIMGKLGFTGRAQIAAWVAERRSVTRAAR
jgi:serine/threonine-protein kinase PknK